MITRHFWNYLSESLDSHIWAGPQVLLIPFIYFFGTISTLTLDYLKYVYDKNANEAVPEWYPPSRREWQKLFFYALKPLAELFKNFHDTFKPFKYSYEFEVARLIKEPLDSSAQALGGIVRTIISPLMTLGAVVLDIFRLCGTPKSYKNVFENISKNLILGTVSTLNGVLSISTGTFRFLTSPLTCVIKPIVRLGVCLMLLQSGGQRPTIENNDGIQSRVKIAEKQIADDAIKTCADIHRKFQKCLERRENTEIIMGTEQGAFNKLAQVKADPVQLKTATVTYLNLFAKPPIASNAAVNEESRLLSSGVSYS